jgi:hypothetical protein
MLLNKINETSFAGIDIFLLSKNTMRLSKENNNFQPFSISKILYPTLK